MKGERKLNIGAFFTCLILAPLAVAQQDTYRPPLGDIMGAIQLRHIKLWFAGKLGNWELTTYEVGEIKASLENAAYLYRGIPRISLPIPRTPSRRSAMP